MAPSPQPATDDSSTEDDAASQTTEDDPQIPEVQQHVAAPPPTQPHPPPPPPVAAPAPPNPPTNAHAHARARPRYELKHTLSGHTMSISSVKFSPDGLLLASCGTSHLLFRIARVYARDHLCAFISRSCRQCRQDMVSVLRGAYSQLEWAHKGLV